MKFVNTVESFSQAVASYNSFVAGRRFFPVTFTCQSLTGKLTDLLVGHGGVIRRERKSDTVIEFSTSNRRYYIMVDNQRRGQFRIHGAPPRPTAPDHEPTVEIEYQNAVAMGRSVES